MAAAQGGANTRHLGEHRFDTADLTDQAPGNLRVDYVLPSSNLRVQDSQVFWPAPGRPAPGRPGAGRPGAELTGSYPFPTSDHRPVRADLRVR